jgi:DNA topoisomerase IA
LGGQKEDLFFARVRKVEANPQAHIPKHLQKNAKGADVLILWLDCDREGENICFEVIENTQNWMKPNAQIYRARFSGKFSVSIYLLFSFFFFFSFSFSFSLSLSLPC